jgi:hypothetical protein
VSEGSFLTSRPTSPGEEDAYILAYEAATRAISLAARFQNPAEAIGDCLGLAARVSLYPLLVLFVPCWFAAAHYALKGMFLWTVLLSAVAEHARMVEDPAVQETLLGLLRTFAPLSDLMVARSTGPGQIRSLLLGLENAESACGGLLAEIPLHAWLARSIEGESF